MVASLQEGRVLATERLLRRTGAVILASFAVTILVSAGSGAAAFAAVPMTLSSTTGPSGGDNTILGTVASANTFPAGTTPTVQFQYIGTGASTCSAAPQDVTPIAASGAVTTAGVQTVDPSSVRRLGTTKIAFRVPSTAYPALDQDGNPSAVNPTGLILVSPQTSSRWNLCVYNGSSTVSSTLLASATYTLAVKPTITSILPAGSPSGGGRSITVNGTGFTAGGASITAAIGGTPLTGIRVTAAGDSFTATTGPHAAGTGLALTVTTAGGSVSSLDPDNDGNLTGTPIPFTYTNGITITPNTASAGSVVGVDVGGAGFAQLTFASGDAPTSVHAHVFLVKDAYLPGSNRGVAECGDVVVIDDSELICTLDLSADQLSPADSSTVAGTPIADGAYILTVVANGDPGAGGGANPTIVSSGATFTVGPY